MAPTPARRPRGPTLALVAALAAAVSACAVRPGRGDAAPADATASGDAAAAEASDASVAPAARPVAVPGGAPVDPDARARRKVGEDQEGFFKDKFDTAYDALRAGEDDLALDLVGAALRLDPPPPWGDRLRALRAEIKVRHVGTDVLRLDVRGERDYVAFDTDVDLVVRVRNVGTSDVVVRPPTGTGPGALSGSILALSIRRSDRDIYAAELTRSWTQTVPVLRPGDPEIRIAPEGAWEMKVRIPAEDAGGAIAGLRVLEVGGELRPARIEAGLAEPFGRIPIRTGRVVALPRNFEPIAADPLGSMRKAVGANAPIHLLVAAEFLAADDRPAAVGVLADALAAGSPDLRAAVLNALHLVRKAAAGTPLRPLARPLVAALSAHPDRGADVMEGLAALTGVSLAPDARLWEDWWRRENAGPASVVRGDEDLGTPASRPGHAR